LQTHLGLVFAPAQAPATPAGAFAKDLRGSSALVAVAERLEQAATIGSVSDLQAIARELNSGDAEQVRLGQQVARPTREFDFEAIVKLASPRQEVHDNPSN